MPSIFTFRFFNSFIIFLVYCVKQKHTFIFQEGHTLNVKRNETTLDWKRCTYFYFNYFPLCLQKYSLWRWNLKWSKIASPMVKTSEGRGWVVREGLMNSIGRPDRGDSAEVDCREEMMSKHLLLTNEAKSRVGWLSREGTSKYVCSRKSMGDIFWETMILGMWLLILGCPNSQ